MAEPTKKKITFQIKINQEGYGSDYRNIQYVEVWVPVVPTESEVTVPRALYQTKCDQIVALMNENDRLRRDLDQANATLKKIENIVVPF